MMMTGLTSGEPSLSQALDARLQVKNRQRMAISCVHDGLVAYTRRTANTEVVQEKPPADARLRAGCSNWCHTTGRQAQNFAEIVGSQAAFLDSTWLAAP